MVTGLEVRANSKAQYVSKFSQELIIAKTFIFAKREQASGIISSNNGTAPNTLDFLRKAFSSHGEEILMGVLSEATKPEHYKDPCISVVFEACNIIYGEHRLYGWTPENSAQSLS